MPHFELNYCQKFFCGCSYLPNAILVPVFYSRMWSHTSTVQDVQVEQAGLEFASVSTREKKRTSCATWKTKQYVVENIHSQKFICLTYQDILALESILNACFFVFSRPSHLGGSVFPLPMTSSSHQQRMLSGKQFGELVTNKTIHTMFWKDWFKQTC